MSSFAFIAIASVGCFFIAAALVARASPESERNIRSLPAFNQRMRLDRVFLALCLVLASACAPAPVFRNAAACLPYTFAGGDPSLPAIVDRADMIVLATVVKNEAVTGGTGQWSMGEEDANRVTFKMTETAKGSVASQFVVFDGPCPFMAARGGDVFVLFLDGAARPDGSLVVVGTSRGALKMTDAAAGSAQLTAVRAIRPLDGDARALLERFGWKVTGKHVVEEFAMPRTAELGHAGREIRAFGARLAEPFDRYAVLSADAGLDPRPFAGQPVELLSFFLESAPGVYIDGLILGHALIADRHIVGAWVSVSPEYGSFSVKDRAAALAAPKSGIGPRFPPVNRVPQGVNIARAYDLKSARGIAYKSGAGLNGEITDPARIRAFADALDELLPTAQAQLDREQPPTRFWIHFGFTDANFSIEYEGTTGMVSVLRDGFSVTAPERFAALVADLR